MGPAWWLSHQAFGTVHLFPGRHPTLAVSFMRGGIGAGSGTRLGSMEPSPVFQPVFTRHRAEPACICLTRIGGVDVQGTQGGRYVDSGCPHIQRVLGHGRQGVSRLVHVGCQGTSRKGSAERTIRNHCNSNERFSKVYADQLRRRRGHRAQAGGALTKLVADRRLPAKTPDSSRPSADQPEFPLTLENLSRLRGTIPRRSSHRQ